MFNYFYLSKMKNVLKLFLLLAVFSVAFAGSNKFKKYEFKSAIVEYKVSGLSKGTKTVYIKDYGFQEAEYEKTTMSVFGMTQKSNKVKIQDGYNIISADLNEKTGAKMKNEMAIAMAEENIDPAEFGKEMLKALGGKKLNKTETILGKKCDIWQDKAGTSEQWIWKNLALKVESKVMGMNYNIEATSLKVDVAVPDSKFKAPKGIKYVDPSKMPGMEGFPSFGE